MRYFAAFFLIPLLAIPSLAAALVKVPAEGVSPIPAEAQLVCQMTTRGSQSESGFPATEIVVADADGGHRTQITHQRKLYNHIAVSPDRTMIAAGRFDRGDTNHDGRINSQDRKTLVVIDLVHRQEWSLVPEADDVALGGVDWTPDGQWIVAAMRFGRGPNIYRVHPDGTGLQNLTENITQLLTGHAGPGGGTDVSVSSDGQWIVSTYAPRRGVPVRIIRLRIDGSEAHFVTDGGGSSVAAAQGSIWGRGDMDPEMSPDSQSVVFDRTKSGKRSFGYATPYDVYRINVDGTGLQLLSLPNHSIVQGVPDWSDDNRIVFSEWNQEEQWTGSVEVNADGSNYHRIEPLKGCTWVRWIPPASR